MFFQNRLIAAGSSDPGSGPYATVRTLDSSGSGNMPVQYQEAGYSQTFYSTIGTNGSSVFGAGMYSDGSTTYNAFLDKIDASGYTRRDAFNFNCCATNQDLPSPKAIAATDSRIFYAYNPGAVLNDITAHLRVVSRDNSINETTLEPAISISQDMRYIDGKLLVSLQKLNTSSQAAPLLKVSDNGGSSFRTVLTPDYANNRIRQFSSGEFNLLGLHQMADQSVWLPVPIDASIDADNPLKILRLPCY